MKRYAVASAHPLSTLAGEEVLAEGGNMFDAALATSAALTVVQPHMNGLGSDLFAVVEDRGVRALNASGYSAALADVSFFRGKGLDKIPLHGPLSSFMVPGIVSGWSLLAEEATMPLDHLFKRAVQYAREGFKPSASLRNSIARTAQFADDDWKRIYGSVGERLVQPSLAKTLGLIAKDHGHSFYNGELAKTVESDMNRKGGLLRSSDLEGFSAEYVHSPEVRYRGYTVYTTPPNSQGVTSLYWLKLLDGMSVNGDAPDYYNKLISTMYPAYKWRAKYIGDPRFLPFSDDMLDITVRDEERTTAKKISSSDTTAFSVFDGEHGISAIQSNYMGFGSGHTVAGTGINLNNRGCYFTLDERHHNAVAPRKRTFHTLMVLLAEGEDRIYLGTMGGDIQPQVNVQILTGIIDSGMEAQKAVERPRFAWPASIYGDAELFAEEGLPISGARVMKRHDSMFGHAHCIVAGATVSKGVDPRGDGLLPIDEVK
ncbi:MAG: gamma-glutamyltransferase [Methanomassiliicoccales archaeon]